MGCRFAEKMFLNSMEQTLDQFKANIEEKYRGLEKGRERKKQKVFMPLEPVFFNRLLYTSRKKKLPY